MFLHIDLYIVVDVAFFWQAHMLSPMRYFEDHTRMNGPSVPFEQLEIPLKSIVGCVFHLY